MTQMVGLVDVEILPAENPASSSTSFRRHMTDDVTARPTSGQRDSAFESIERRFRADLSRRLRELRARVERSRGRATSDPAGRGTMPTIAVKRSTGAWSMPRPTRRRCASYQSVTHALSSLAVLPPRALSASAPPMSRRHLADSRDDSLSDDPLTSPEVAGSRDSMTSCASDPSAVFDAPTPTLPDSAPTSTSNVVVGGGSVAVIANYGQPEIAQRIRNTRLYNDNVKERADFDSRTSTSSYGNTIIGSHRKADSMPVVRPTIEIRIRRRLGYEPEALQRQSSATLEDSCPTPGSGYPSRVADAARQKPEIAVGVFRKCDGEDVVPTSLASQTGTGSSLEERRPETRTIDSEDDSRSESDSDEITVGDEVVLQPAVDRGLFTYPTANHVVGNIMLAAWDPLSMSKKNHVKFHPDPI